MLRRLRAALDAGLPVPVEVAAWLSAGLDQHEAGKSLEQALGLMPTGYRDRRAAATSCLWELFCMLPSANRWPRCERLASLLLDYYRTGHAPTEQARRTLQRLFALEHPPTTPRGLFRRLWGN